MAQRQQRRQQQQQQQQQRQLQQQQPSQHHGYFIHDYRTTRDTEEMNFDDWKHETCELTKNMTIINWHVFRTPMNMLGRLGPYVMQLSSISPFAFFALIFMPLLLLVFASPYLLFVSLSLSIVFACYFHFWNHHFRIEHGYVVFELIDGPQRVFVSLEKIRGGILFQIAPGLESVRGYRLDESHGQVERVRSSENFDFEGALESIVPMELILQFENLFDAYYSLLRSNCQHTVTKLLSCLAKNSMMLKFPMPGSEKTVGINDDEIVTFVEMLYPKWAEGKVQQFPEIPEPFAMIVENLPKPECVDHQLLIVKQRIVDCLLKGSDWDFLTGRKAVFSKLDKESFKESIAGTNLHDHETISSANIIDHVASLWNGFLDIVAVLEDLGVIIFHFPDESKSPDHMQAIEQKLELASKIESLSYKGENCIHVVSIALKDEGDDYTLKSSKRTKYGRKINISISFEMSENNLEECLMECLQVLADAPLQSRTAQFPPCVSIPCCDELGPLIKPLQKFTAKLFLLQHMKNKDFLIHDRLVRQKFGPREFCVWTPQQKRIIDEAKNIFGRQDGPQIQWVIQGCYGSGKTLVLMQLAKEFVESGNAGNVVIHLAKWHGKLKARIRRHVKENGLEDRVSVGYEPKSANNVGLLLWDEFLFTEELQSWVEDIFLSIKSACPLRPFPDLILFTSDAKSKIEKVISSYFQSISWIEGLQIKSLGGNLRSSTEIASMTGAFQKFLKEKSWRTGEPVVSNINWSSWQQKPVIVKFNDETNDRSSFLHFSKMHVTQLAEQKREVMVSAFMHGSLIEKLEGMCKIQDNTSFGTSPEIIGNQYQCVVVILDLATCTLPGRTIADAMTRATTSLHLILNTSLKPVYISDIPLYQHQFCPSHLIESGLRDLITRVAQIGKKILIGDIFDFLSASVVDAIKDEAEVWKIPMPYGREFRDESKNFSLGVHLCPVNTFSEDSTSFFPPFVEIMLVDEAKDLQKFKMQNDLERTRKEILEFFMFYFDPHDGDDN